MSETKHTSGPWVLWEDMDGIHIHSRKKKGEAIGDCLALVFSDNERPGKANARLIAAAPEMKAALEAAWAWFNDEASDDRAWSMIQAALAKAEGRED